MDLILFSELKLILECVGCFSYIKGNVALNDFSVTLPKSHRSENRLTLRSESFRCNRIIQPYRVWKTFQGTSPSIQIWPICQRQTQEKKTIAQRKWTSSRNRTWSLQNREGPIILPIKVEIWAAGSKSPSFRNSVHVQRTRGTAHL